MRLYVLSLIVATAGCAGPSKTDTDGGASTYDAGGAMADARPGLADAGPPGPTIAYEDLPAAIAEMYCAQVFACCTTDERTSPAVIPQLDVPPDIPDEPACVAYMTELMQSGGRHADMQEPINFGTVEYDAERAAACVAQYAALACPAFGLDLADARDLRSCSPYVGTKGEGEGCYIDEQCTTDYCEFLSGQCQVKPAVGEACPDFVCAEGSYCDWQGDSTCKAKLGDGESCADGEACASGFCEFGETGDVGACAPAQAWICDGV